MSAHVVLMEAEHKTVLSASCSRPPVGWRSPSGRQPLASDLIRCPLQNSFWTPGTERSVPGRRTTLSTGGSPMAGPVEPLRIGLSLGGRTIRGVWRISRTISASLPVEGNIS